MRERALNYLTMRYFYLIGFADYCIYKRPWREETLLAVACTKEVYSDNLEKQRSEFVTEF